MASIIEELVSTLDEELRLYNDYIPVCRKKTTAIIKNNLDEIQAITGREQQFLEQITTLERKRSQCMDNMAMVTGKKAKDMNLSIIIKMLDKQPEEQKKLSELYDNLKTTTRMLVELNKHNTSLIKQSLEMIEFNMNFIQSTWTSPGNNNYDRAAQTNETSYNGAKGLFDAKQ